MLQYSISSGSAPAVSLGEELATVKDYLGIQQVRFGARLRSLLPLYSDDDGSYPVGMLLNTRVAF